MGLFSHKHSEAHDAWREWHYSAYAKEIRRRQSYYEGTQFRQGIVAVQDPDPDDTDALLDAWNGSWSGHGWADLRAMLPEATQWNAIKPDGINATETLIDNIAVAYTLPVEARNLLVEGKVQEEASATLNAVYSGMAFNKAANQHCKMTFLCDTHFQVFSWDSRNTRMEVTSLTPDLVMVEEAADAPLDLQHPDCKVTWLHRRPPEQERWDLAVWQVWHGSEYWYETGQHGEWQDADCTVKGRNENPYVDLLGFPVKPIVVSHSSDAPTCIHEWGSDSLIMAAQRADRNLTAVAWTMETQGFAIPEVRGMEREELEETGYGPGAPFVVKTTADPNAGINFKHPLAPIGEVMNAAIKQLRLVAQTRGVDPDLVDPEKKVTSGVATAQGRLALRERRDQQFPQWLPYEREVYWIVSVMWDLHVTHPDYQLPRIPRYDSPLPFAYTAEGVLVTVPKAAIEVVFGELDPIIDPLADVFAKKARVEQGLESVPEQIMAERGVTLKRATEIYEANIKLRDKYKPQTTFESFRTGQSGNRPRDMEKPSDKGNTTAASGNQNVDVQPSS